MEIYTPDDLIPARVQLLGHDSNAGALVGSVAEALRAAGNTREVVSNFRAQAYSGDYTNLLAVCMAFCEDQEDDDDWV
jgi:hypothetical protein